MKDLTTLTIKQLKEYAMTNNIDLFKITGKQNIIDTITMQTESNKQLNDAEYIIDSLIKHSGKKRNDKLNVTAGLFYNKALAKKWYYKLSKTIHPDVCKLENTETAFMELNKFYNLYFK